jgi:hypothetical protein
MKSKIKIVIGILIGGAAGFAYYYFVGCRSGSCPITGSPVISTLYGSFVGGLLLSSFKSKPKDNKDA